MQNAAIQATTLYFVKYIAYSLADSSPGSTLHGREPAAVSVAMPTFVIWSWWMMSSTSSGLSSPNIAYSAPATTFNILSGSVDFVTQNVFASSAYATINYAGLSTSPTTGYFVLSQSAPGSGDWTLNFIGSYSYQQTFTTASGSETFAITDVAQVSSTAQFGTANTMQVAASAAATPPRSGRHAKRSSRVPVPRLASPPPGHPPVRARKRAAGDSPAGGWRPRQKPSRREARSPSAARSA